MIIKIILEFTVIAITIGIVLKSIWETIKRIIEGNFKKAIADIITTMIFIILLMICINNL